MLLYMHVVELLNNDDQLSTLLNYVQYLKQKKKKKHMKIESKDFVFSFYLMHKEINRINFHSLVLKTMLLNKQNIDVQYKNREYVRYILLLI